MQTAATHAERVDRGQTSVLQYIPVTDSACLGEGEFLPQCLSDRSCAERKLFGLGDLRLGRSVKAPVYLDRGHCVAVGL